jgi:hypothetical protein
LQHLEEHFWVEGGGGHAVPQGMMEPLRHFVTQVGQLSLAGTFIFL